VLPDGEQVVVTCGDGSVRFYRHPASRAIRCPMLKQHGEPHVGRLEVQTPALCRYHTLGNGEAKPGNGAVQLGAAVRCRAP
jgi:hypothetical protein